MSKILLVEDNPDAVKRIIRYINKIFAELDVVSFPEAGDALQYAKDALAFAVKTKTRRGEGSTLTSLGLVSLETENPTIAIAVVVEHGYWGNRWAGPIATLMIEKYVNGKISRTDLEATMLNGSLLAEYEKVENIIFQRFPEPKKQTDSVKKTELNVGEAKKEEDSN